MELTIMSLREYLNIYVSDTEYKLLRKTIILFQMVLLTVIFTINF